MMQEDPVENVVMVEKNNAMFSEVIKAINAKADVWEQKLDKEDVQIYRHKALTGAKMMLKINAEFKNISAEVAFQHFANMKIRQGWDVNIKDMIIIEGSNDNIEEPLIYYYPIFTP